MNQEMKSTPASSASKGFALVITLSLMILLTVIAVGLLTLSSISLRSLSQGAAMATARANARLAMMMALGELQKSAGPDQRVTAPANLVKPTHPEGLAGVWKSWKPTPSGVSNQNYVDAKTGGNFLGYLTPFENATSDSQWDFYANYARLYRRIASNDNPKDGLKATLPVVTNPSSYLKGISDATLKKTRYEPDMSKVKKPVLMPTVARVDTVFSLVSGPRDGKYVLCMMYLPVITLHNPYNVPLRCTNLQVEFSDIPIGFEFLVNNQSCTTSGLIALNEMYYVNAGGKKTFNMTLSTRLDSATEVLMKPGETKIFGTPFPKDSISGNSDWQNNMTGSARMIPGLPTGPNDGVGFVIDWLVPRDRSWEVADDGLKLALTVPEGTRADVLLPQGGKLTVNGKPGTLSQLEAGVYQIEVRELPAGVWADPTDRGAGVGSHAEAKVGKIKFTASSSHEVGGWSVANLMAAESDLTKKGYSSASHDEAAGKEWVEIDLGEEATFKGIVLVPRSETKTKDGGVAGFPRDFTVQIGTDPEKYTIIASLTNCPAPDAKGLVVDLYTVIGYPKVRFIKINVTRFGEPAADEAEVYRLQLERVKVMRP
jgi:hypothetical protein